MSVNTPEQAMATPVMAAADKTRHKGVIKGARNALLVTAGLVVVSELIGVYRNGGIHPVILLILIFGMGKFLLLAFWTRKKPFNAVFMGLLTFISINFFAAIVYAFEKKAGLGAGLRLLADGVVLKMLTLGTLLVALSRRKQLLYTQRMINLKQLAL